MFLNQLLQKSQEISRISKNQENVDNCCKPYKMKIFKKIIGKRLTKVNYVYNNYQGFENDSEDFDYLAFGGLHIRLSNNKTYCIADYNKTKNDTSAVGIQKIIGKQIDLTDNLIPERITEKWAEYINKKIIGFKFYIKKEDVISYTEIPAKNEFYYESVQLDFENEKSIFYFCGDVDHYNHSLKRYNLISGRDSGVIFFNQKDFNKYKLDNVERIEKYSL